MRDRTGRHRLAIGPRPPVDEPEEELMASYHPVPPAYWSRSAGWPERRRLLGLYLFTCEHRATEGLYRLPLGYIAEDLGWTRKQARDVLAELEAADFAMYDEAAGVVFVPEAVGQQPPGAPNQITGALARLERVPDTILWHAFADRCATDAPRLAERLPNRCSTVEPTLEQRSPERMAEGSVNGSARTRSRSLTRTQPLTHSSPDGAEESTPSEGEGREDVDRLCQLLAELMLANNPKSKVAPQSKGWKDPVRLLLDRDGHDEASVERVIRWCQADDFWRTNILSPSKLRKQFDQLTLKMQAGGVRSAFRGRPATSAQLGEALQSRTGVRS